MTQNENHLSQISDDRRRERKKSDGKWKLLIFFSFSYLKKKSQTARIRKTSKLERFAAAALTRASGSSSPGTAGGKTS